MKEYKIIECSEDEINKMVKDWWRLFQIYTYTRVAHYSETYIQAVLVRKYSLLIRKIKNWRKNKKFWKEYNKRHSNDFINNNK